MSYKFSPSANGMFAMEILLHNCICLCSSMSPDAVEFFDNLSTSRTFENNILMSSFALASCCSTATNLASVRTYSLLISDLSSVCVDLMSALVAAVSDFIDKRSWLMSVVFDATPGLRPLFAGTTGFVDSAIAFEECAVGES